MLTVNRKPSTLTSVKSIHQVYTIIIQDSLTAFQERSLQVEIMQNLDQRSLETWDLKSIFDSTDESYGIYLSSDVLQQPSNES